MIKMQNGATVLRADLLVEQTGMPGDAVIGVVLCHTRSGGRTPYVTWRVMFDADAGVWHASSGNYFGDVLAAMADYNSRRGMVKAPF